MSEKDWKKEAYQLHIAFHQTALDPLSRATAKITDEETRKEVEKTTTQMHNLFDTAISWVEKLSEKLLKLEGALEEARRKT